MKFASFMLAAVATAAEPNPPNWGPNVIVLTPGQGDAQSVIDNVWFEQGGHNPANHGQFSESRYALLFEPGYHSVAVNVGFYTQALGLGRSPTDTQINDLWCENGDYDFTVGALDNFWRGVENLYIKPTYGGPVTWAVSQASPMRRMYIDGDLWFFQVNPPAQAAGYASGGFVADTYVTGSMQMGSQQQFITRNCGYNDFPNGVWNFLHVGDYSPPAEHCSNQGGVPSTVVTETPVIREKPYIIKDGASYKLMKPNVEFNKRGTTQNNWQNAEEIDFSNVYVASESDSAATINAKLDEGLHLILQPGQYKLDAPIKVNNANTVVLGLGLATLIPTAGNSALEVGDVDGVAIAGILFQAGTTHSDSLLKVGSGNYAGNASNPVSLHDMFARVGGPSNNLTEQVSVRTMAEINTGNVVIDDTWFWRADHDIAGLVKDQRNPVDNGIVVNGDNVTAYGLACEHTLGDMTYWAGNNGKTYFYQSEFPYDVDNTWQSKGYAGYRVADNVTSHEGYGIGVYSYFRDNNITADSAIKAPEASGVHFKDPLAIFLNGNGGIRNIVNNDGKAVYNGHGQEWNCSLNEAAALFLQ